ncbi:MAG TPA: peptidoglycan-binding domain-containing protein [Solirubrobacteraceae bacterium]|nr:peptidoglycan-binding domain-containing protein [Solirubrobacteraceae bacterium]
MEHSEVAGPPSDGQASGEHTSKRSRLRWLVAGALAVAVAAVLAVVLLDSPSGEHHSADTGVPAGDITAGVTRRTLSESSTIDGTLGYGSTLELYDRVGGTFTWLPSVGAVIGCGGALWRIDDQPVVLMYGSVPAYRTLERGISDGPDVTELNQNLIDLGYDPYGAIVDDQAFSEATAAAVRRWQKAEGLPETGEVELGRVVFAPSARRVTAVKVALGQDPPGATALTETTPATPAATESKPATTKSPASKHTSKSPHKGKKEKPKEEPKKEATKEKPAKQEPAKDSPSKESPGGGSGTSAGEVVLTTTSTQQLVQLKVKPEQQQLAKLGETVAVQLPGGGQTHGRITQVGTVASESTGSSAEEKNSPSSESGESATIAVTIALGHHVAHLDEAPVSVELVKSVRRNVLAVPATALIATAGGGYAIEALVQGRRVMVPVAPGMFADGYVQVEGARVRNGLTVIESQ